MKVIITILMLMLVSVGCSPSRTPQATQLAEITNLVARIQPDMPLDQLTELLGVEGRSGEWAGQGGSTMYTFPSGHTISVACYSRDGGKHTFVHPDVIVYIWQDLGEPGKRIR